MPWSLWARRGRRRLTLLIGDRPMVFVAGVAAVGVRAARHDVAMSCMGVDPVTRAVLDDLAVAAPSAGSVDAVAVRLGLDACTVLGVIGDLVAIGWVFGGPERWQLTGVGHSHTSHRPTSGLLSGGC